MTTVASWSPCPYDDRDLEPEAVGDQPLDRPTHRGGRRLRGDDRVSALEVGTDVVEPGAGERVTEVGQGDSVARADVDAAQEEDLPRHHGRVRQPASTPLPLERHLLRAKDLVDARYREPLDVPALARAAHLSPAHFSREFRRAFGETPHQYLLTRRLERAAALLRNTDRSVADICFAVGLRSVGSFTTSFGRAYGVSPTAYRAAHPPPPAP